ncbi:hypothetical protein NECAME_18735 [Necator americanus]|uniref:Solute carrier family 40 member n=1 Tax=Necator americanus TaxID=51031 RepID=W2SSP0_NECAM|nr:hypothetical protein NECAME_18735 [Necator americanus]ETN72650.1 hypothetical protein NECAME_18735 [Necator americanus]
MADLSIIHIMQEGVPESDRNTVFGVHNALCQTFSLLKDILVIILPDPATFGICILISYGFVTTGYFSFVYYLIRNIQNMQFISKVYKLSYKFEFRRREQHFQLNFNNLIKNGSDN